MRLAIDLQLAQTSPDDWDGRGRTALALTEAMLREAGEHEIILAFNAHRPESLAALRRQFAPLLPPERMRAWRTPGQLGQGAPAWRVGAAEALRESFLASLRPDVVHVAGLLQGWDDDGVTSIGTLPGGPPAGCMVPDLGPLVRPMEFFGNEPRREWYRARLQDCGRAARQFTHSAAARRDAIARLNLAPAGVVNIGIAPHARYHPQAMEAAEARAIAARFGLSGRFLCGFGAAGELDALFAGFAALPATLRQGVQLALLGPLGVMECVRLDTLAERLRLGRDAYRFLGAVAEAEMPALLRASLATIHPAPHDGSGLRVVEAMAAGVAVLCGDRGAPAEVVGCPDALFDPTDVQAIAGRLAAVLGDAGFRAALRAHGLRRAAGFSWRSCARTVLESYADLHAEACAARPVALGPSRRPRLAWLAASPLPPGRAGELVTLAGQYEIDLLLEDPATAAALPGVTPRDIAGWPARRAAYQRTVIERDDAARWLAHGPALLVGASTATMLVDRYTALGHCQPAAWPAPARAARLAAAIERSHAAAASPLALAHALAARVPEAVAEGFDQELAAAMVANLPPEGPPRLLLDVTVRALGGEAGGIARVTNRLVKQLLLHPPQGVEVTPIRAPMVGSPFRHARRYAARLQGLPGAEEIPEELLEPRPGDRFLGVDLHYEMVHQPAFFRRLREVGGECCVIVHDFLPLQRPDWFPPEVQLMHAGWLDLIAGFDRLVCTSRAVEADTRAVLGRQAPPEHWPALASFFLAGDLPEQSAGPPFPELAGRQSLLMVSTVYARKGHAQALAAFEQLWAAGVEVNLVIVGRVGFGVDAVIERLRQHPQRGQRLFWFDDADDATLSRLYATVDGVLIASEAEGFGLPLVEATHHGQPVLARDLPVFRETLGERLTYFTGLAPGDLAEAIRAWLPALADGSAPRASAAGLPSWADAARRLLVAMGLRPSH